jgi:flagellar basal-body rod protein FlgC
MDFALKPIGGNMNRPLRWLAAFSFLFVAWQGQGSIYGKEQAKYYTIIEEQVKDSLLVKYLRDRGVKLESDPNGLLRIYVYGSPGTIPAVVKFLGLMNMRMKIHTENLVNFDTIWNAKGNPYRRKDLLIDKNGNATVVTDETSPIKRYNPSHPYADKDGYVLSANIDKHIEIINLIQTSLEYILAERLLERCLPDTYIPNSSMQMPNWNTSTVWDDGENRDRLIRIERKLDELKLAR